MNKIIFTALLAACLITSCKNDKKKPEPAKGKTPISGQWMIMFPIDNLVPADQKEVYALAQDSIIKLYGLKLISFADDGSFVQADSSLVKAGSWFQKESGEILIDSAGLGFEDFRGNLIEAGIKTMGIAQIMTIDNETFSLFWRLHRLNVDQAKYFFGEKENLWRKKASVVENDSLIRERIRSMLEYYSAYFTLVSEESSYFSVERTILPFSFYQHAVGLKPYKKTSPAFLNLFYDEAARQRAYKILEDGMIRRANKKDYPSAKDYVLEYAMYMKKLAEAL